MSNWASHVNELGPSFMKIWTCRSSPRSGSRNAWTRIKNVNGANSLSNIWIFFGAIQMTSCRNWWLWTKPGYITMTRRQNNNEWNGGIAAHLAPKHSECKNPLEKLSPRFFGSRQHPPHLVSSKGSNYQRGVLHFSAGANEGHFERKILQEVHQGGIVLEQQCPGSLGTCNPEETGLPGLPLSWSPTLFSGSGPVGLPPVTWTEKTIERSPFFIWHRGHCCCRDLVGRTTFWIFFWVVCRS